MKKKLLVALIAALVMTILFLLSTGCLRAQDDNSQISGITTIQTGESSRTIIFDSKGDSDWVRYTIDVDYFSIYAPSDYEVQAVPVEELTKHLSPDTANEIHRTALKEIIYVYPSANTGYIMIYGHDLSDEISSIFDDPQKTKISNDFYDKFVKDLELSLTTLNDSNIQTKVDSVEKDNNYYKINGNPARHVGINFEVKGQRLHGDGYLIAHEHLYYLEFYTAMEGASQADASTASNIMQTFSIL